MISIHPHIQVRGPGHYGRDGTAKISYTSKEKAQVSAERRVNCGVYACGDHWHIYRKGWPHLDGAHHSPPRGWLELDWELGVRAASRLREENSHPKSVFQKMKKTLGRLTGKWER